eukprot:8566822-Ditylum_brightwellii.AAC.1
MGSSPAPLIERFLSNWAVKGYIICSTLIAVSIQKALQYYTKDLLIDVRKKAWKCMVFVKFGMKSTLIRFRDCYYQHKGAAGASANNEEIGLAIGSYELAFFDNLVISYLLKKTENQFIETITKGIYHGDGLMVFSGIKSKRMMQKWQD